MLAFFPLLYYHAACRVLTPIITQQEKEKLIMSINLKNKQDVIKEFGANEKDTGSAEVQIAILTKEINDLTEHLKAHIHD